MVLDHHLRCVPLFLLDEQVAPAQRAQARVVGLAASRASCSTTCCSCSRASLSLWGTWFPKISGVGAGHQVTVGAPFYNSVAIPVALLLLLLTALGPLLAWRKTSLESPEAEISYGRVGRAGCGPRDDDLRSPAWNDTSYFYALMAAMLPPWFRSR